MRLQPGDRLLYSPPECGLQLFVMEVGSAKVGVTLRRSSRDSSVEKPYEKPPVTEIRLSRNERAPEAIRGAGP